MKFSRRSFIRMATRSMSAGVFVATTTRDVSRRLRHLELLSDGEYIMTVRGPVPVEEMGVTLTHEHLFSIFGLDPARHPSYDESAVSASVLPRLKRLAEFGCRTLVEATAAYFGRDPMLLKRLSYASGVQLVTNTGYYGAASDRYVPEHARTDSVDELAARWIREWTEGIEDTGIRPGFIKIGVDQGPLSEIDRRLVQSAARAHRETGLTMAVHTGDNPKAAAEQLSILAAEGVAPSAWIWVHAHSVTDVEALVDAASKGAWISLDGLQIGGVQAFVERLKTLRSHGVLGQVLLSHDGNSYPSGSEGAPRPFEALFTHLVPALEESGFTGDEIHLLTAVNPRRAFAVNVRLRS
jgi:phosphotriesterase-related protein